MQEPVGAGGSSGGGGASGGGANEFSRVGGGGLARFRSAPTSWLDALLEDDDSLKLSGPHQPGGLTQLLTAGTTSPAPDPGPSGRSPSPYVDPPAADPGFFAGGGEGQSNVAFHRMSSSPAEFLSGAVDGYFSSFGNISASYDFAGSSFDVSPAGKRLRDADSDQASPSFSPHRRGEQGGQLSATASGLLDMEMEKLLEDTVPCRVRAKRGCATHPRSIAERVRRTRISDRIRKLQELVPNMEKQTNTADMLDEAVEYVKNLQKQIQELTEQQKRCKCTTKS